MVYPVEGSYESRLEHTIKVKLQSLVP